MKNLLIVVISILLIVSVIFNVKQFKNLQNLKSKSTEIIKVLDNKIKVEIPKLSEENNAIIMSALYEPSTPANWHKHPNGQVLYVTSGEGYYQEENQPAKKIKKGDFIITKPNVKSWHGSTKNSQLEIVVISTKPAEDLEVLELVSDEEYNKIADKEG